MSIVKSEQYNGFNISVSATNVTEIGHEGKNSISIFVRKENRNNDMVNEYYCGVFQDKNNGIKKCLEEIKEIIDISKTEDERIKKTREKGKENTNNPFRD